MSELKTKKTQSPALDFINTVEVETKRQDALTLLDLFKTITTEEAVMWGSSIVGFGKYHYKLERSTQEGDWPLVGFSPRKQNLTLYLMPGFDKYETLLAKLGKHKISVGCLYINKLSDVDIKVLTEIITQAFADMKQIHSI